MMPENHPVLLLNPPHKGRVIRDNYCSFSPKSAYLWPPVDLLYLSSVLSGEDRRIYVADAVASKQHWSDIRHLIGRSAIRTVVMLTGTVSWEEDLQGIIEIGRQIPFKLYVCGNLPAFHPEFLLSRFPEITGVLHLFTDNRLGGWISGNRPAPETVSYRNDKGEIVAGSIRTENPEHSVATRIQPHYKLFPMMKYSTPVMLRKPVATCLTSIGCPYRCHFCVAGHIPFFTRTDESLSSELHAMQRAGIREIFFEDATLNHSPERLETLCRLLKEAKRPFCWSANIHSKGFRIDHAKMMKEAGCHTVMIGVETGNGALLRKYAPSKDKDQIRECFGICRSAGLRTLGYFILGFPEETLNTARETIDFALELDPDWASFSLLTPDAGTGLRAALIASGTTGQENFRFDSSYSSPLAHTWLTEQELRKLMRKAYRRFYFRPSKWIAYSGMKGSFPRILKNGLSLVFNRHTG